MAPVIPARESSKYAGQYAGAFDPLRIAQIFTDSQRIALSSKAPNTAADRYALALEAYHQIMSMQAPAELLASVKKAMAELVESFPTRVVANEALGLREKARKMKTPAGELICFDRRSKSSSVDSLSILQLGTSICGRRSAS